MASDVDLLPQHQQLIVDSAIGPVVAEARGYRTVRTRAELRRLGFSESQARVPALLIPIHDVRGETFLYQIRPDSPRMVDGKCIKYETPRGARMAIDVPPAARKSLGAPERPLFITEGARKADSAVSRDLCCIMRIAMADPARAFDKKTGALKSIHKMPKDIRRAISGVDVEEVFAGRGEDRVQIGQVRKVRFWSKTDALAKLAQHIGMLDATTRHVLQGAEGGPVEFSFTLITSKDNPKGKHSRVIDRDYSEAELVGDEGRATQILLAKNGTEE